MKKILSALSIFFCILATICFVAHYFLPRGYHGGGKQIGIWDDTAGNRHLGEIDVCDPVVVDDEKQYLIWILSIFAPLIFAALGCLANYFAYHDNNEPSHNGNNNNIPDR
ncbi:MAG: hypothetical protein M1338_03105 [Patescibacteria group bacterium]|nr:hypothetical protein [Patescibacteria group bacterium]